LERGYKIVFITSSRVTVPYYSIIIAFLQYLHGELTIFGVANIPRRIIKSNATKNPAAVAMFIIDIINSHI